MLHSLESGLPATRPLNTMEEVDTFTEEVVAAIQQTIEVAVPWARSSEYSKPFWTSDCSEAVVEAR